MLGVYGNGSCICRPLERTLGNKLGGWSRVISRSREPKSWSRVSCREPQRVYQPGKCLGYKVTGSCICRPLKGTPSNKLGGWSRVTSRSREPKSRSRITIRQPKAQSRVSCREPQRAHQPGKCSGYKVSCRTTGDVIG